MITGFNHTSFTVADMAKSVKFWTENLGFEARSVSTRDGPWQAEATGVPGASLLIAHLYGHGGHHVEFIQYLEGAAFGAPTPPSRAGTAHVCLDVDDIDATWQALLAAGATAQGSNALIVNKGVVGGRCGYIRDPNGILIELFQVQA